MDFVVKCKVRKTKIPPQISELKICQCRCRRHHKNGVSVSSRNQRECSYVYVNLIRSAIYHLRYSYLRL